MRKVIYFIMMLAGFAVLACLYFFPIYQYDDASSYANNTDYYMSFEDSNSYTEYEGYKDLTEDEKEAFKKAYETSSKKYYAVMNNDTDGLYAAMKWDAVNYIYKKITGHDGTLTADSSEETINSRDDVNKDLATEQEIEEYKQEYLDAKINQLRNSINTALSVDAAVLFPDMALATSDADTLAYMQKASKYMACYETMKYVFHIVEPNQSLSDVLEVVSEKADNGIMFMDLVNTWIVTVNKYIAIWNATEGGVFAQLTACFQTFDIIPFLIISVIVLLYALFGLGLVFGGIRGMIGRVRPKKFVKCAIMTAIGAILVFGVQLFGADPFLGYFDMGIHFMLKLLLVGGFDFGILIPSACFALCLVICILGWCCPFSKAKN